MLPTNYLGFYVDQNITPLTASFVYFPFNAVMREAAISNDDASGSNTVVFSWDGTNVHGSIKATETLGFQNLSRPGIYLMYGTGAPAYRVFASSPS